MLYFIRENKFTIIILLIFIILVLGIIKLVSKQNVQNSNYENELFEEHADEILQNEELDETQNMVYDDIFYGEDI